MGSFPETYNNPEFACGYWGLQSLLENKVKGANHQDTTSLCQFCADFYYFTHLQNAAVEL